jgi:predicted transcriptional regulator
MPNRSTEDNEAIILNALREAGENGLTVDEVRVALCKEGEYSNSLTKKLLERIKAKGHLRMKMGRSGPCYYIISGH